MLGLEATAWSLLGDDDRAAGIVTDLAGAGMAGAALRAGLIGVYRGDRRWCEIVDGLPVSGPLPRLIRGFARAVRLGDVRELVRISQDAAARMTFLLALSAADHAVRLSDPGSALHAEADRLRASAVLHVRGVRDRGVPSGTDAPALTRREAEISALIAQGLSNTEIAQQLGPSQRTVEGHINRIYRKAGQGRRR